MQRIVTTRCHRQDLLIRSTIVPALSQPDLDAAVARMDLVRDDLHLSGTGAVRRFPTMI